MSTPISSLASQIGAIERAREAVPSRKTFRSEGEILLEQKYLADAATSLRWLEANRDWIVEAAKARREEE